MPHKKHKDNPKKPSTAPLSQEEEALVQQQLANYQQIAATLYTSQDIAQIEEALAPISHLSEGAQTVLLMALSREKTTAAADVLLAINTFADLKEVRKEARRSLIRMEGFRHYPSWTPPSPSAVAPAPKTLEVLQEAMLDETEELFAQLMAMALDPTETIAVFLDNWLQGNYAEAYTHLASASPLREGLSLEEWVARRTAWAELTHPSQGRSEIAYQDDDDEDFDFDEFEDEEDEVDEIDKGIVVPSDPAEAESALDLDADLEEESDLDDLDADFVDEPLEQEFEAFWSLVMTNTEEAGTLPEVPQATAIYNGTGRHWFWTRYSVVHEEDKLRILAMVDAATEARNLPAEELQEKLADIVELASEHLELVEALNNEDEDEDDDELELEEEYEELDDDDEDDEDEDDFADMEFDDLAEHFEEMVQITTRAMHYTDALIAQTPTDATLYDMGYDQATAIQENERAAAYIEMQAERFPEMRGPALRKLAIAQLNIAGTYEENEDEDQAAHFVAEAEKTLRASVASDGASMGYILLAETLIAQEKQLEEAEQLLQLVLAQPDVDDKEATLAESGMGRLAENRGDKESALHHYQHAAAITSDLPGIWFNIGSIQHELGQLEEAEQSYRRSIEETPTETNAYAELAAIYADRDDPNSAEMVLEEGLEINPEAADLLAAMALLYINKGNLRHAKEYLDEAEDIDENLEIVQVVRQLYDAKQAERKQHKQQKGKSRKFKKK